MTPLIEKYLNIETIQATAKAKNYDEISYAEYIRFIDNYLQNSEKYGYKEDPKEALSWYADEYMSVFVWERKKGFSTDWAREYALRYYIEEQEEHSIAYAFDHVKGINPNQAITDLRLYAELNNQDEHFIKHFTFFIEIDELSPTPPIIVQAKNYSEVYKQQIAKGKSEAYAHKYAEMIAEDKWWEYGCEVAALEYEKAIQAGCSPMAATCYADDISDVIVNEYSSYEDALEDVLINQKREKLIKRYWGEGE